MAARLSSVVRCVYAERPAGGKAISKSISGTEMGYLLCECAMLSCAIGVLASENDTAGFECRFDKHCPKPRIESPGVPKPITNQRTRQNVTFLQPICRFHPFHARREFGSARLPRCTGEMSETHRPPGFLCRNRLAYREGHCGRIVDFAS